MIQVCELWFSLLLSDMGILQQSGDPSECWFFVDSSSFDGLGVYWALFSLRSLAYLREIQKTAWIVTKDEVFLPTSNLEHGSVSPNLDRDFAFCEWKTPPAFRN